MASLERGEPSGLLTDLYQLTMAAGYWRTGIADREAVFHLTFRENPFGGGFAVACGLEQAVEHLRAFRFDPGDLAYLGEQRGNDGRALFAPGFLDALGAMELACDVDAVPEGTVVFAGEPLLRVRGPLAQAQILETALLNVLNFQTLIATKAARVCEAAGGAPVLEFGLRRAQGPDGGLSAARAAYVGGCVGTSNVLAGRRFGVPVKGTHAHSWVMSFPNELAAFEAYAEALPNNCIFLVDTYDTLDGVDRAIRVGRALRERGHALAGVRLDSGDLVALSREARRRLDAAGFADAAIVGSNDLDEHAIARLRAAGAEIGIWGVGTRLATAFDQPALGGVYKLGAWRRDDGSWQHVVKLSEDPLKVSNPGIHQVRRFRQRDGSPVVDVVFDELAPPSAAWRWVDRDGRAATVDPELAGEDLLVPVARRGRIEIDLPPLPAVRERALAQRRALPAEIRRLEAPARYPVGLDEGLHRRKLELVEEARRAS